MVKLSACALLLLVSCGSNADETDQTDQSQEGTECTDDVDRTSLDTKYGSDGKEPEQLAAICSVTCYFVTERLDCITDCIREGTGDELSRPCSGCLALAAECASAYCAMPCSIDPTVEECVSCRCGDNEPMLNCEEVYEDCSGIISAVCR